VGVRRSSIVPLLAVVSACFVACSLIVDTSGLDDGAAIAEDAAADGAHIDADVADVLSDGATADASGDASADDRPLRGRGFGR